MEPSLSRGQSYTHARHQACCHLVIEWDPTRPWHTSHSATHHQVQALGHLVGSWSDGIVDPRSWGFASAPAREYFVRASASRLRALRRILAAKPDAVSPIRPTIRASAYGMSTAASGSSRRAGQPDRQPRASLHSLISQSSQGPPESEGGPQAPPQMLPGCNPKPYNLTTYHGALPPKGAEFHTRKAPGGRVGACFFEGVRAKGKGRVGGG